MKILQIKTDEENAIALTFLEYLIDEQNRLDEQSCKIGERIKQLSSVISKFEEKYNK